MPEFIPALDTLPKDSSLYDRQVEARQQANAKMYDVEDDATLADKLATTAFENSTWKTMPLPGDYKKLGLPDVDGIVWFRKLITLPDAWAGKEIILHLGPIDEIDRSYCNGGFVGGMGRARTNDLNNWNVPRVYHVPGKLVKAGDNALAIRVTNTFGAGGLWVRRRIPCMPSCRWQRKTRVPLAGDWGYHVEFGLPCRPIPPDPITPACSSTP